MRIRKSDCTRAAVNTYQIIRQMITAIQDIATLHIKHPHHACHATTSVHFAWFERFARRQRQGACLGIHLPERVRRRVKSGFTSIHTDEMEEIAP